MFFNIFDFFQGYFLCNDIETKLFTNNIAEVSLILEMYQVSPVVYAKEQGENKRYRGNKNENKFGRLIE